MNDLEIYTEKTFDDIKHIDEYGNEYWYARELQVVLEYAEWRKFNGVIEKAKEACYNSGLDTYEHFVGTDKLSNRHNNAQVYVKDYKLSRYACYLIRKMEIVEKKSLHLLKLTLLYKQENKS